MDQGLASHTSSSSSSSSTSSSDSSTSSGDDSDIDSDTNIKNNSGNGCDWLSEECIGTHPKNENLKLKKRQHPGGSCTNLVHHISAVTWGKKHGANDVGNLCRKHTSSSDDESQDNCQLLKMLSRR